MKYLIIKGGSSEDFDKYKKNDEINMDNYSRLFRHQNKPAKV